MGVFKGFNISYPTYSVITPQTGLQYDVRCLTVGETNELKHSNLTPVKSMLIINKIIWKSLQGKPEHIQNYNDFLRNTTINDFAAIVYGSYYTTFGSLKEFSVVCEGCQNQQTIKFDLDKIFKMNPYPNSTSIKESYKVVSELEGSRDPIMEKAIANDKIKFVDDEEGFVSEVDNKSLKKSKKEKDEIKEPPKQDIISKRVVVELPVSKVKAIIKQPTLFDEEKILNSIPFTSTEHLEQCLQILPIDKFEYIEEGRTCQIDTLEDILAGFNDLPLDDKAKIFEEFYENFGKYAIELKTLWGCKSCGYENEFIMNIVNHFFRVVQTVV